MARKITKQQQARITQLQDKRLKRAGRGGVRVEGDLGVEQEGLLVAHYGVYVDVEAKDGAIYRCNIRQNLLVTVPGDRVIWQAAGDGIGVLVAVMPRRTLMSRPVGAGKIKTIAANVDQVMLVIAPQPRPALSLIDSYLVAIETLRLQAIIICNKRDLLEPAREQQGLIDQLALYQKVGYPVLLASAERSEGLVDLEACLHGQTSVFVGQSGVGKSSLIARLLPQSAVRVDTFSPAGDHGMHTTTTARLYHLPSGGDLIDSPGVRDFILWDMPAAEIAQGFVEFRPYLGHCQFRDCRHVEEKQCAVQQAVADGAISLARLTSYQRIIAGVK